MKKSLVALAVLAASGAAMAQSSVTLYGWTDVYFASTKNENNAASVAAGAGTGSITQNELKSAAVNGNRWGLQGTEDLGGGLSANFNLQQGFAIDTGAAGSTTASAFSRQSWVGLAGGFGAVRLGRTTTPYDDYSGASNAVFDSAFAPMNNVFRSTGYTARPNNTIYYQSPAMGGVSAALSYSLGENKTASVDAGSTTSVNVAYAGGPLGVHFAYQTEKATGAANAVEFARLGATYAFGPATVKATYGRADNIGAVNGADATDWQLGVDYAVSGALTVSASYASSDDNATAGDDNRKGFGLGAKYTLSKRTFVYGGFESDTTDHVVGADSKHSIFGVGINHRF